VGAAVGGRAVAQWRARAVVDQRHLGADDGGLLRGRRRAGGLEDGGLRWQAEVAGGRRRWPALTQAGQRWGQASA
jgi:hypothetical protein